MYKTYRYMCTFVFRNQRHWSCAIFAACKKWCAADKQGWKTKCTWSKSCGGCCECKGEWLGGAVNLD